MKLMPSLFRPAGADRRPMTKEKARPPKIAAVGFGSWGRNLARNFAELGALAGICEIDPGLRRACGESHPRARWYPDFTRVLRDDDIEAVAIATPAETHGELVRRALIAGKDVFVEKPLCLSVDEAATLVDLARKRRRILMVGHLLRYHPAVLKLKSLVDAGELGRIRYIYSCRLNLGRIRREENSLWSFAPHDISVILDLLGEMPDAVRAQGGNYLHARVADVTVSLLSFPSGVKAHVFVSWLHPYKEQKLVVIGDRKMAVFDDIEKTEKLRMYPHSIEWKDQVPVVNKAEAAVVPFDPGEPLRAECLHFLDCLRSRRDPRTDGAEGVRVLRVLQQCQDALESGGADRPEPPRKSGRPFFAHPTAVIDDGAEIGEGTRIWHFSHILEGSRIGPRCTLGQNVMIGPRARLGEGVKIQNNVSVYEGVTLEDQVFCGPSMVFTNVINPRSRFPRKDEYRPTRVGRGATLGANSTILCGVTIGCHAFIGAGSVVTRDVPEFALVYGTPARLRGWMCECGRKLGWKGKSAACSCRRRYRKIPGGVRRIGGADDAEGTARPRP